MAENEFLLTEEELERVVRDSRGNVDKSIARAQLAKVRSLFEVQERERIVKGLESILKEAGDLRSLERDLIHYVQTLKEEK